MQKKVEIKECINEELLVKRLKKAEQQIKNHEVTDSDIVLAKMREKYGY